jgi:hypothetical protein
MFNANAGSKDVLRVYSPDLSTQAIENNCISVGDLGWYLE